jgi:hypothetical protein
LKHDADAEQHLRVQPEDITELRHEAQVNRIEAGEKHHHEPERDVMVEGRAGKKPAG